MSGMRCAWVVQSPPDEPAGRAELDVAALRAAAKTGPPASSRRVLVRLGVALCAAIGGGLACAALTSTNASPELAPAPRVGAAASPAPTATPTPPAAPRPSRDARHVPSGPSPITGGPGAAQGHADWLPALSALDTIRSRAFATGSVALLNHVYAQGSAVLSEDRRRLEDLRSAGLLARGLRPALVAVGVIRAEPGTIVLKVRDCLPSYTIVDHSGDVVERRPGRGEETWQVTIVPAATSPGHWHISSIRLADRPVTE
jgi:hypothetical protein